MQHSPPRHPDRRSEVRSFFESAIKLLLAQNPPSPATNSFVESVLQIKPRVAAFDCDGTLWSGDAGERFFDWEMKKGFVNGEVIARMRARYAEYKAGRVSEDDMCGLMVTMHQGLSEAAVMDAATEFMTSAFPGHIFPEMQHVFQMAAGNMPEADDAIGRLAEWVRPRLGLS